MAVERLVPARGVRSRRWWYVCSGAAIVLSAGAGLYVFGYQPMARDLRAKERANASQLEAHAAARASFAEQIERARQELEQVKAAELARANMPLSESAEPVEQNAEPADVAAPEERRRVRRAPTASKRPARHATKKPARTKDLARARDDAKPRAGKGALSGVLSDSNDPLMGL